MASDIRPVLHVHISGSAGTTMCHFARQQQPPPGSLVAGASFNCLLPCKAPVHWKVYAMNADSAYRACMVKYGSDRRGGCEHLERRMREARYGVLGAAETILDEANNSANAGSLRTYARDMQRKARGTSCADRSCCGCNAPSLYAPDPERNTSIVVHRGQSSAFDRWWPLHDFRPLGTYCSNIRYTLLMHEPVHRAVSQLLLRCPSTNRTARTCTPWAVDVLRRVYAEDLLLDSSDGGDCRGVRTRSPACMPMCS
jgi:hypothetical protein